MTREEAITVLQKIKPTPHRADGKSTTHILETIALDMAIEALKQESKTGHWIEITQYSDAKHKIECSECGNYVIDRGHANSFNVKNKYKYCPNCGAKMESEVEK